MRYHVVAVCEWVTEMDWDRISRVSFSNNILDGYFLAGLKEKNEKLQIFSQTASIMTFETEASSVQILNFANFNSTFVR